MAKPGRPPVLDEVKQREIVAIISMGCSRRTAAKYVGCGDTAQSKTRPSAMRSSPKNWIRTGSGGGHTVKNINAAAKKAQYWRAAAWVLERLNARGIRHAASRCDHRRADVAVVSIFIARL